MLEVAKLVARYGMHSALRGVSLGVGPGEVVRVLGAKGAGKSTLLKVLAGLVKPFGFERLGLGAANLAAAAPHERVEMGMAFVLDTRGVWRTDGA